MSFREIKQSWHSCEYAVRATSHSGKEATILALEGLYDSYGCKNKEILELKIYPTTLVREGDGSKIEVASLFSLGVFDFSESRIKQLQSKVEIALGRCRQCKFYEVSRD